VKVSLFIIIFFFFCISLFSQENPDVFIDIPPTTEKIEMKNKKDKVFYFAPDHSPKKAALLSLAAPGLGQIYNKKYWKIGLFYTAIGGSAGFLGWNAKNLRTYNKALSSRFNPDVPDLLPQLSEGQITNQRDFYRRNVELMGVVTIGMYVWNILDAFVDGHLRNFDVSDDLSLKITPMVLTVNNINFAGVGLILNFN
jgi:hypothetical protein